MTFLWANVSGNIRIKWRVEPYYISAPEEGIEVVKCAELELMS